MKHLTIPTCIAMAMSACVRNSEALMFSIPSRPITNLLKPTFLSFPSLGRQTARYISSTVQSDQTPSFQRGDSIQIEVVSFGPLGATVDVVGVGHAPDDLISQSDPALGSGLVLQREIHYFREARNNVDVVKGEVLPGYVENVREDGKVDVSLRVPGGKAKADEVGKLILDKLEWAPGGSLPVGDKSSPRDIADEFPGISKAAFKKAVSSLYKKGLVKPGPDSITLINQA